MESTVTQSVEQYSAEVESLMGKIAELCDGKPFGVVTLALLNGLTHVAQNGGQELRALILQSMPDVAAGIEAMDAPRH